MNTTTVLLTLYNSSLSPESSYSDDSSSSPLISPAVSIVIALIGLLSTVVIHYNVQHIKICCIKINCIKKKVNKDDVEYYEEPTNTHEEKIIHTIDLDNLPENKRISVETIV
uniref:Uncharacterized protein n=1 Tax=viral metagenome TaxID=1070528 RepID=A0A6C0IK08_9ZZZZ